MSTYLTRKDGRYLYRRRFPKAVADAIGKAEMKRALGTADRTEALKLSRSLSVEFDRICEAALAPVHAGPGAPSVPIPVRLTADDILRQMQAAMHRVQVEALERMQAPGWQRELAWRRASLAAHAAGDMPTEIAMHPTIAAGAMRALDSVVAGDVPMPAPQEIAPPRPITEAPALPGAVGAGVATQAEFELALEAYCVGKSKSRKTQARNVSAAVLRFPCAPAQAEAQILEYLTGKLEEGIKPSTLRTASTLLFAILKWLPGFEGLALPKRHPTTEALRGEMLDAEARAPVPRDVLLSAIRSFQEAGDDVSAAAFRLLALYGMRPSELLREGPSSIQERRDVLGNVDTVFVAGLTMRKTRNSKRALPIHPDDLPLFATVHASLGLAEDCPLDEREHRGRIRSNELAKRFRRLLPTELRPELSLYGVRHLFADLARAAGATEEEAGALLGHTTKGASKVTGIYGGGKSLGRAKEILSEVRALLGVS
ncbi:DUF6538 domain-containing protein [Pseudomonas oryzihabitans]|uniref:DUF6538 domain-containing protein n=1 Tax=Pseudomonas oryzihabitans TaxID=47885 RepID=UPI0028956826|nr:DUF6538 domain-containing protein [Pseudomonas oryzihabitans]MDT3718406.1 hypothetical protein [Pseudomonas oryzihabitans]